MPLDDTAFAPLFARTPPAPGSPEHQWLVTALRYPPATAADDAVAPELIVTPLQNTLSWLATILRKQWHPPSSASWYGLRESVLGSEVLFAGWRNGDRLIQVASRKTDLHLRTTMGPMRETADDNEVVAAALILANALTTAEPERQLHEYRIQRLGDFVAAESLRDSRSGWLAFSLATDRVALKLSFVKIPDRRKVKRGGTYAFDDRPWFDPPPEKRGSRR